MHVAPPEGPIEGPPSPFPAGRYTAWLVGPLALALLLAKVHKLVATPGGDVGSGLAALFPDVVFVAAFVGVAWAALRFSQGPWRVLTRVLLHLVTLLATALVFIEHGFWLTTGTLLDPYTLGYGLEHIGALGKVYLSEMGITVWLGFAALLAVHWLPVRAVRRGPLLRVSNPLVPVAALLVLPACMCVAALALDVAPPVEPLSDNVVVEFAAEALAPGDAEAVSSYAPPIAIELGVGPRALPEGPPPNVIIIVMESLRARSTSLHDETLRTTPFLDALAARGAYAQLAWTTVTHTSKAIVGGLCGIYPKLDVPIDEAESTGLPPVCLAHLLRERGYATGFMQTATGRFERRDKLVDNMGYETFLSKETIAQRDFEETSYFGWEDEALVAPAIDFVKAQQAKQQPFFLTLLTLSTHHTYATPSTFTKQEWAPGVTGELDDYLNAVAYLDQTLAKLFAQLEATGALDNTLVVLTGDHGEGFGEHGRRQHDAVIYEEGLHVPLLVVGPGVAAGRVLGGLRSVVDIAPTVLEWLGTPVVSGLPGKSLLSSEGHDQLFASCWLRNRCMATLSRAVIGETKEPSLAKYIWHYDKQSPELFDLGADPLEQHNVLSTTKPEVWTPMKDRLLAWKGDNIARWSSFFALASREFVSRRQPRPQVPLDIVFAAPAVGDEAPRPLLRLIGVDAPRQPVVSGAPIQLTLYWETLAAPGAWTPFTHLIGVTKGARPRYNGDHTPVGGQHPTALWVPGTFITDEFRLQPSKSLEPGKYDLVVGLWDPTSKVTGIMGRAAVLVDDDQVGLIDKERRAHVATIEVLPELSPAASSRPATPTPPTDVPTDSRPPKSTETPVGTSPYRSRPQEACAARRRPPGGDLHERLRPGGCDLPFPPDLGRA